MKKPAVLMLSILLLAAGAAGGYFAGYQTAYDRMEAGGAGSAAPPQTFYAEITAVSGNQFSVEGLPVNDINFRGTFTFSVVAETELVWRGTAMEPEEFEAGDTVAVSFSGEVLESYPAQLQDVVRVQLLDDEK